MSVSGWVGVVAALNLGQPDAGTSAHPWPHRSTETIATRFAPPPGTHRLTVSSEHFGAWSRTLPIKPGRGVVYLHDGRQKARQDVHAAVIDIDIGERDLQQCADLGFRLHAEWSRARGKQPCFRFTSGHAAPWQRWADGERPKVRGRRVVWASRARPDSGYRSFRGWLDIVFSFAGSASMERDSEALRPPSMVEPGDLLVEGGHPGHVVVVLDVAVDPQGRRFMLLAQSFMPAQSPHILKGPDENGPWYPAFALSQGIRTPEWTFAAGALRRFPPDPCR